MQRPNCINCHRHSTPGDRVTNINNYNDTTGKMTGTSQKIRTEHFCTFRNIRLHNLKPVICSFFQPIQ